MSSWPYKAVTSHQRAWVPWLLHWRRTCHPRGDSWYNTDGKSTTPTPCFAKHWLWTIQNRKSSINVLVIFASLYVCSFYVDNEISCGKRARGNGGKGSIVIISSLHRKSGRDWVNKTLYPFFSESNYLTLQILILKKSVEAAVDQEQNKTKCPHTTVQQMRRNRCKENSEKDKWHFSRNYIILKHTLHRGVCSGWCGGMRFCSWGSCWPPSPVTWPGRSKDYRGLYPSLSTPLIRTWPQTDASHLWL